MSTKMRLPQSLVILDNVAASDLAEKHRAIETLFDTEYRVFVAGEFISMGEESIFLGNTHPQGAQKTRELNVFAFTQMHHWFQIKRENSDKNFEWFRPENGIIQQVRFILKSLQPTED